MRGVRFGRPRKPVPENFEQIYDRWLSREISAKEAARQCNLTTDTFYRRARRHREEGCVCVEKTIGV